MTDREILQKYIDLDNSCLTKEENKEVMNMMYRYRVAFSLRDEIGTYPNIEVEIDVTDKSPLLSGHTMLERKTKHLLTRSLNGYAIWEY